VLIVFIFEIKNKKKLSLKNVTKNVCDKKMTQKTEFSYEEAENYLNKNGADQNTKQLVHNAVEAVNKLKLWDWFRTYNPERGYMFENHENIDAMTRETETMGHSGATFGFTLRYIQNMAIDYENYPEKFQSWQWSELCSIM